jgi:hypothetical protein
MISVTPLENHLHYVGISSMLLACTNFSQVPGIQITKTSALNFIEKETTA